MTASYTILPRGMIRIGGPDRLAFLQNLVTNDTALLRDRPALYAAFLSPQGKFLHDFIMTDDGAETILDCEAGARAEDLLRRLKMYKLRSKIELAVEPDAVIYAGTGVMPPGAYTDPRHESLGWRSRAKPENADEEPFASWDERRIRHGVPDGSRDMAVDRDTPLECNFDRLNGVSFTKGCYVGQEITARMHLRHIVKKHLHSVTCDDGAPGAGEDITVGGHLAGQMRSRCGALGMAMIRDDALSALGDGPVRLLAAA